jgi:hypothetical protein
MVNRELEEKIFREKEDIRLTKISIERTKKQYKEDIKGWNKHLRSRKSALSRLEKKYYGKHGGL